MSERRALLLVAVVALALRALAAAWLGPGPFGPDGPGAIAAVTLGGHPYPLHPLLIGVLGARPLSVLAGALVAVAVGRLGSALGGSALGAGLLAACAPLLVYPSALAGGDAAATAAAAGGLALAWGGWPLLGGVLAGSSVGIKPIAFPLLPALLLASLVAPRPRLASARAALGAVLGAAPFLSGVMPLLRPRPRSGLLGTWWLSSEGAPPALERWPELLLEGATRIAEMPSWTGLQLFVLLAGLSLWRAERRAVVGAVFVAALLATWAPATLLGEQLQPRYLGPASLLLVALAGAGLRGPLAALGLLGAWPALAFISQLSALRAHEERLTERALLGWPGSLEVIEAYRESGVCGAGELRVMSAELAERLPDGATVTTLRLRDGREGELTWPLLAARSDLRVEVLDGGRCPEGQCLDGLRGVVVFPDEPSGCETEVVDVNEQALAAEMARRWGDGGAVFGSTSR